VWNNFKKESKRKEDVGGDSEMSGDLLISLLLCF